VRSFCGVAGEFAFVLDAVVVPDFGDIFQEQHCEDVVFVLRRIDGGEESIAGFPEYRINFDPR
jgi:hypothetical protein